MTLETKTYYVMRYDDYIVEIELEDNNGDDMIGMWLHKDGYGTKEYMFGVLKKDYMLDDLTGIDFDLLGLVIDSNIDEYIDSYAEDHEQ